MSRALLTAAPVAVIVLIAGASAARGQTIINEEVRGGPPGAVEVQPMPTGTGGISGRVVAVGPTSRGIGDVLVTLTMKGATPQRALTDTQGAFAFWNLPAGDFFLTAERAGYATGAFGRVRVAGPSSSLILTNGQQVTDATLLVWKLGVITGRVTDEHGDPVVDATVRVFKRGIAGGVVDLSPGPTARTDDRGIYRISSLEPGDYAVALPITAGSSIASIIGALGLPPPPPPPSGPSGPPASGGSPMRVQVRVPANCANCGPMVFSSTDQDLVEAGVSPTGQPLVYQTTFYPSALSASRATLLTIGAGDERTGVNFQLRPVPAVTVSGHVTGAASAINGLTLNLVPAEASGATTPIEAATTTVQDDGTFRFTDVASGQYVLRGRRQPGAGGPARVQMTFVQNGGNQMMVGQFDPKMAAGGSAPLPTEPTLWTEESVSVGSADLTDLAVPLREGLRVSGRVKFDGSANPPPASEWTQVPIALEPADAHTKSLAASARGRVDTDGQFTTVGVPEGRYILDVSGAPKGWSLAGAMFAGQDITSVPFDLRDNVDGVVLTFTDRQTTLEGTVTSRSGGPDDKADVIVFPAESTGVGGHRPTASTTEERARGGGRLVLDRRAAGRRLPGRRREGRGGRRLADAGISFVARGPRHARACGRRPEDDPTLDDHRGEVTRETPTPSVRHRPLRRRRLGLGRADRERRPANPDRHRRPLRRRHDN